MQFSTAKTSLILILLLLPVLAFSQQLSGRIISNQEQKEPLVGALVMVYPLTSDDLIAYAISDTSGYFKIELESVSDSVVLKCSYLSYQKYTKNVSLGGFHLIELEPLENRLDEVTIKAYKIGVRVVGDSLIYDPIAYTTGGEKNLKEVLNKLPGMEVEENGNIKVHGKNINKIYINGDDFLNKNRSGILESLSGDIASEVIFSEEYNEMSGKKEAFLNIKTSKKATKKEILTGLGSHKTYKYDASVYALESETKYLFNAKGENTGKPFFFLHDFVARQNVNSLLNQIPRLLSDRNIGSSNENHKFSGDLSWKDKYSKNKISILGIQKKRGEIQKKKNYLFLDLLSTQAQQRSEDWFFFNTSFEKEGVLLKKINYDFTTSLLTNQHNSILLDSLFIANTIFSETETIKKDKALYSNGNFSYKFSEKRRMLLSTTFEINNTNESNLFFSNKERKFNFYEEVVNQNELQLSNNRVRINYGVNLLYRFILENYNLSIGLKYDKNIFKFNEYRFLNLTQPNSQSTFSTHELYIHWDRQWNKLDISGKGAIRRIKGNIESKPYFLEGFLSLKYPIVKEMYLKIELNRNNSEHINATPFGHYFGLSSNTIYREISNPYGLIQNNNLTAYLNWVDPLKGLYLLSLVRIGHQSNGLIQNIATENTVSDFFIFDYLPAGKQNTLLWINSIDYKWNRKKIGFKVKSLMNRNSILLAQDSNINESSINSKSVQLSSYSIFKNAINYELSGAISDRKANQNNFKSVRMKAKLLGRHFKNKIHWNIYADYLKTNIRNINYWTVGCELSYTIFQPKNDFSIGLEGSDILGISQRPGFSIAREGSTIVEALNYQQRGYLMFFLRYQLN